MSNRPSREPSPSNSPKQRTTRATSVDLEASSQQATTFDADQAFAETPQFPAGQRSQSAPNLLSSFDDPQNTSPTFADATAPVIVITASPTSIDSPDKAEASESSTRQSRGLASRHRIGHSSSQPPRRSATPYSRPRSRSQPREASTATVSAMSSSSSSPGNTTTSGPSTSTSGSNPTYTLPYAPFPYPMPRGSGQGNQGGSSSGK